MRSSTWSTKTMLDSGTPGGWLTRRPGGTGWARSYGGLRGRSAWAGGRDGLVGSWSSSSISSSYSCFWRCPRFSSISECRTFQLHADAFCIVVDVLVNRSDKLQQFIFVVGGRVLFLRYVWFDIGYMVCVCSWSLLGVFTHFPRGEWISDPEVGCVLHGVCGMEKYALSMLRHVEIWTLLSWQGAHESPLHLAVICGRVSEPRRLTAVSCRGLGTSLSD